MKIEFKIKKKVNHLKYSELNPGKIYRVVSVNAPVGSQLTGYMDHILVATGVFNTERVYGIWLDYNHYAQLGESTFGKELLGFEEFNCKLVEV